MSGCLSRAEIIRDQESATTRRPGAAGPPGRARAYGGTHHLRSCYHSWSRGCVSGHPDATTMGGGAWADDRAVCPPGVPSDRHDRSRRVEGPGSRTAGERGAGTCWGVPSGIPSNGLDPLQRWETSTVRMRCRSSVKGVPEGLSADGSSEPADSRAAGAAPVRPLRAHERE